MRKAYFTLFLGLMLVSGCSSIPNINQAREFLKQDFEIYDLKKTNGVEINPNSYEITFTSSVKVLKSDIARMHEWKIGDKRTVSGVIVFQKTEKGWIPIKKIVN